MFWAAQPAAYRPGGVPQHAVTRKMPVDIVVALENIQVE
jgi:hypothetical protein